jgi:hypothetical protein
LAQQLFASVAALALQLVISFHDLMDWGASIPGLRRSASSRGILQQTVNVLEHYCDAWRTLAVALLLCLVAHLLTVAGIVALATSQPPLDFGFPAVMSALANQIPIAPDGLALGEGTFEYMCRLQDPENLVRGYGTVLFGLSPSLRR